MTWICGAYSGWFPTCWKYTTGFLLNLIKIERAKIKITDFYFCPYFIRKIFDFSYNEQAFFILSSLRSGKIKIEFLILDIVYTIKDHNNIMEMNSDEMICDDSECFCLKNKCVHQEAKEAKEVVQESLPEYILNREVSPTCIRCFRGGCNGLCQTKDGKNAIYYGNYDYCRTWLSKKIYLYYFIHYVCTY